MEVTVLSMLPTAGGRVVIPTDPNNTIHSLINAFCSEKQMPFSSEYVIRDKEQQLLDSSHTLYECDVKNGETLFIGTKELSESKYCCCNWCSPWWFLAVILLLIGIAGIVTVSLLKVKSQKQPDDYGVVLDAGSSHTQVFVYKWPADKENGTGLVKQVFTQRAPGGGISNYTEHPELAGESLRPVLDSAVKHVPAQQRDVTPIWLGATAGMRLLNESDHNTSVLILDSVRRVFQEYPFWFNDTHGQVRILPGIAEGTFAWVTTNFLAGAYAQYSLWWNDLLGHTPTNTYGALDLGGASTQITFIPEDTVRSEYARSVDMYGTEYTVYSHSYLCYGLNEAYRNLTALLVIDALAKNVTATEVPNPCQPQGNSTRIVFTEIFEAPCTSGHVPPNISKNTTFTFVGTSNSEDCAEVTRKMFDFDTCDADVAPCSFNNVHQPDVFGGFYAFSGYWNTLSFLNATDVTLAEFESSIGDFCAKNWTEVSGMKAAPRFLIKYCFDAHYIHTLLVGGYKFNNDTWNRIKFKQTLNDADLGWSLGYMINATNRFPERHPTAYITPSVFVLLLLLFIIFLAIAFAFGCHARQRQRAKSRAYTRLTSYGAI